MPLQTASVPVESRGNKLKKILTRVGAIFIVLVVVLSCIPILSANAVNVDDVNVNLENLASTNKPGTYSYDQVSIFYYYDGDGNVLWSYNMAQQHEDWDGVFHLHAGVDAAKPYVEIDNNGNATFRFFQWKYISWCDEAGTLFNEVYEQHSEEDNGYGDSEAAADLAKILIKFNFPYTTTLGKTYNYAYRLSGTGAIFDGDSGDLFACLKKFGTITSSLMSLVNGGSSGLTDYGKILDVGARLSFSYYTGVTIGDLISDMGNALKAWIAPAVASSYAGAIAQLDDTITSTTDLLTQSISGKVRTWYYEDIDGDGKSEYVGYDAQGNRVSGASRYQTTDDDGLPVIAENASTSSVIYDVCYSLCQHVILPVAGVILAFVFAWQIYEAVCERNNMNDMGTGFFIQLIIKMCIMILVVINAWVLVTWIFELGQWIVKQAVTLPEFNEASGMLENLSQYTGYTFSDGTELTNEDKLKWIFCYFVCTDSNIDFGTTLVLFLQGIIINIGMLVISVIVWVIVYVRLIEIYLYCAMAPIPLATLSNRTWQQTGLNYIRSIAALALQAILILLCLAIFNAIVANAISGIGTNKDIAQTMWGVIGYSIILVFCLFKTGNLSKSIMAAH